MSVLHQTVIVIPRHLYRELVVGLARVGPHPAPCAYFSSARANGTQIVSELIECLTKQAIGDERQDMPAPPKKE